VQERCEAHGAAARELVRERFGEQGRDRIARFAEAGPPRRVALQCPHRVEHLQRVVVDVRVMELVLLHAAQRREFRQHDVGQPELEHQGQAAHRVVRRDDLLELAEHALRCHASDACGVRPRCPCGGVVELERQLGDEAHGAQCAQRIVGQRRLRDHAEPPRLEVGAPPVRVEQLPARERLGHGVDREVARREVGGDVAFAQRHEVDVPSVTRSHDPPGAERARELERRAARGPGDLPRGPAGVALERDVDVVGRPPEQPVAHGAAHQPRLLPGERRTGSLEWGLRHPRYPRGTRAVIAQVTS
jgi:hypothetical protein